MARRSLGSLGTPKEPIDLDFDYFGLVIRVNPNASDIDLVGYLLDAALKENEEEAAEDDSKSDGAAMQATARYLKGLIHEDDWETFWRAAKANRQSLPDMMKLGEKILEEAAGVPSEPPTDSSDGRPTTKPKSKVVSSSRRARSGSRDVTRAADTRRALAAVPEDRPDIKEQIILAHEARVAEEQKANATTAERMGLKTG